jgi:hypothetical protein
VHTFPPPPSAAAHPHHPLFTPSLPTLHPLTPSSSPPHSLLFTPSPPYSSSPSGQRELQPELGELRDGVLHPHEGLGQGIPRPQHRGARHAVPGRAGLLSHPPLSLRAQLQQTQVRKGLNWFLLLVLSGAAWRLSCLVVFSTLSSVWLLVAPSLLCMWVLCE